MGFLDIGPMEILLILVIALIIWGPGKIPEIAKTLGRTINAIRKASFDLTTQIKNELDVDVKKESPQSKKTNDDKSVTIPESTAESKEGEAPSQGAQSEIDNNEQ
jgi:sec-independent protein translocase protein TatA